MGKATKGIALAFILLTACGVDSRPNVDVVPYSGKQCIAVDKLMAKDNKITAGVYCPVP